jgi:hypothetical protein
MVQAAPDRLERQETETESTYSQAAQTMSELFDPPKQTEIILISCAFVFRVQREIASCEDCSLEAETPFDSVLDYLTGRSGTFVEYILECPAHCLSCGAEITEKTLVVPRLPYED